MDVETQNLSVNFSNVKYSVRIRGWRSDLLCGRNKVILDGISGCFKAGELSVIMGVSGAGKTSLLNILAGAVKNFSGKISVISDREVDSVYILQENLVAPLLTVNEAMNFAFYFKISSRSAGENVQEVIDKILESLNLTEMKNTRSTELSGGEKRRLTIALEMIRNPTVMFFDEPTSGLDSTTSIQCVKVLKKLAKDGRVIIATVHQPAPLILQEADQLYFLAEGKCIYRGTYNNIVHHLCDHCDILCPQTYNPAEFLLEIASNAYDNDWKSRILTAASAHALMPPPTPFTSHVKVRQDSNYASDFMKQLTGLVKRRFLITYRDISLIGLRTFIHMICIVSVCIMYRGVGEGAENVLNNLRYLLYTCGYFSFVTYSASFSLIPREIPIVKREHFNGWYSILPYYLSLGIVDLPLHIIAATLYSLVTFWVTGQPMEPLRLAIFTFGCIALVGVAHYLGYATGFIFNVQNASIFGQFFMSSFFVTSGYFVPRRDAPTYLYWLFDVSFMRYGQNSFVLSIYGLNRTKLECNDIYCHYNNPKKLLHDIDVEETDGWIELLRLLYILFFFFVIGYFIARHRISNVATRK
ncbi:hypothetical protein DMENIID0001_096360 [Sergentomyia squamirostris]